MTTAHKGLDAARSDVVPQRLQRENALLRAELAALQVVVDELLDRESMYALSAQRERLTPGAEIERYGRPRTRCLNVASFSETRVG